jgi:hypothetical protein
LDRINPSRPVYSGLQPDPRAKAHLIAAEADGAGAVIDLFARADAAFAQRATVLYVPSCDSQTLDRVGADDLRLLADIPSLLRECTTLLKHATMGTAVYVSGTQGFIGEVAKLAAHYGVAFPSLRTEQCGSPAKRVQCVHCKSIEEQVLTSTVVCSRCRIKLFVRDHYSHRLNAFMGVSAEAEEPIP